MTCVHIHVHVCTVRVATGTHIFTVLGDTVYYIYIYIYYICGHIHYNKIVYYAYYVAT